MAEVAPSLESNPHEPKLAPESRRDSQSSQDVSVSGDTLSQLSRQLEYYFSTVNLSTDTYLRTLRELNDGYVPATILANFTKVQLLCPYDSYGAVIKAAAEHSEKLEVVNVDKESGKRVLDEGPSTLIAIGPKDLQPIELPTTPTSSRPIANLPPSIAMSSPSPTIAKGIQNTIILREVPTGITEDDIRHLFDFEKCPPIQQVYEDVSRYWFVSLKTASRDEMMHVMLALRSKTLNGEPIKARLKSASISSPNPSSQIYSGDRNFPYGKNGSNSSGTTPRFGKKNNKPYHSQAPRSPKDGKRGSRRSSRRNKGEPSPSSNKQVTQAPPPPLVESQFPALEPVLKKEEDEDIEDDAKPLSSDGASTATTSTSSSVVGESGGPSKPKAPVGGYAAALLKAAPVKQVVSSKPEEPPRDTKAENGKTAHGESKMKNGMNDAVPKEVTEKLEQPVHEVDTAPRIAAWGGGGRKSFAEVLKKENSDVATERPSS